MFKTRDGGIALWGWSGNTSSGAYFINKFDVQGNLLWLQAPKLRDAMTVTSIRSVNEMSNGDIWVTGSSTGILGNQPVKNYTFTQRLHSQTGDSIYSKYLADTLDLRYLHSTALGDRIFGISEKKNVCLDCSSLFLAEYEENGNFKQSTNFWFQSEYILESVNFSSTESGELYINSAYHQGSNVMLSYPCYSSIINTSGTALGSTLDFTFLQKFPLGDILAANWLGLYVLDKLTGQPTLLPETFFGLTSGETRQTPKLFPDGSYLVPGTYQLSPGVTALFLMKVNAGGNKLWKQYYPEEVGTSLVTFEPTPDGGAILLLTRQNSVRLVKTNSHGQILGSQAEIEKASLQVSLYPNPTSSHQVTLVFPRGFSGTLQIFDLTGKLCTEKVLTQEKNFLLTLPTSMAPGLYQLQLTDQFNLVHRQRFLKR
ncbi:MAG: T9SS type A sorting domain-containing protein [Rufibacter sp.]